MLALQQKVLEALDKTPRTVDDIAKKIGADDEIEHVFKVLEHAAANPDHGVVRAEGRSPFAATYSR